MPGGGGIELQRRLADSRPRLPIIFITSFPEEHVRVAAIESGACGFFAKPVDESSFILCIEGALARS
jgi:FixJ family two-component response regulator